jgi:GTPase Era involved in 16S rRNA processing
MALFKVKAFKESFQKLTSITVELINKAVFRIDSDTGSTEDKEFIAEFMNNTDVDVFDAVKTRLDDLKEKNKVKPFTVNVSQDSANPVITEVPIVFDYASFFA